MSDFAYQPDVFADEQSTPRVLSAKFGDGYEQVAGDGINTVQSTWELTFTRAVATIDTIEAFFVTKGGVTSFTWTPSGGSEIRVRCKSWRRSYISGPTHRLTASFERVYAT